LRAFAKADAGATAVLVGTAKGNNHSFEKIADVFKVPLDLIT
jgi:hypothetical protein